MATCACNNVQIGCTVFEVAVASNAPIQHSWPLPTSLMLEESMTEVGEDFPMQDDRVMMTVPAESSELW
jgi:hypothetical protein